MKKLLAIAGFLLASTAAQAQYTFEYGGRTIRVDPDRGTVSIPGVYDNTGRRKHVRKDQDGDRARKPAPQQATVDPQAPAPATTSPAPSDQAAAPANAVPENAAPTAPAATANATPADIPAAASPPPLAPTVAPAPPVQQEAVAAPTARPSPPPPPPAPAVATAPPAQRPQGPATTVATAQPSNSPLGLWLTEEKEGKVRIEQCGANLCGYSVDAKSNQNGEQVLINMKPGKDSKWSGRIFDPNTGSTYDSTIALKSPDSLRVQGCAFGGMFCGGQTWSRLN
jgi:Uncharacterized protein conserved in bacteria (DUF2147)